MKSTLFTIALTLQLICENPDIRVFIGSGVEGQGKTFLREIKDHAENNDILRLIWADVFYDDSRKESPKWTEDQITVKRKKIQKESTVTVGSPGKETTGSHFDFHIYDDLVCLDNVTSRDQMNKVFNWYKLSLNMLMPKGRRILIGTRYDYSDMYGQLLETGVPSVVLKCRDYSQVPPKVLFPKLYDNEALDLLRRDQGSYNFSCQFDNEPVDPSTAPFKRKNLHFWSSLPESMNIYVLADLAISDNKRSCETALEVIGYSVEGNLYCIEDCAGIFSPTETVEHLYRINEKYGNPPLGVERQQLEKALQQWLLDYAERHKKKMLNYYELKPDMDKTRRIIANLQPMWEQDRVFLKPGMEEMENQLLRFPRYGRRDRIDALAYFNQLVYKPGIQVKTIKWTTDYGRIYEQRGQQIIKHPWKPRRKEVEGTWMGF